jgi:RNase H-fold protein (predicted Holliday junction resolvase)
MLNTKEHKIGDTVFIKKEIIEAIVIGLPTKSNHYYTLEEQETKRRTQFYESLVFATKEELKQIYNY